jgi:capsular polysaccharide transport system permease protein
MARPTHIETSFWGKFAQYCHVIAIVLMQDTRSRQGSGSLKGYFIVLAMPLAHLALLTVLFYFRTMIAPVVDSTTLFIATGVLPYILCIYPARQMAMVIGENRQLLNIPCITPTHLITSRTILEMLNAVVVMMIYVSALTIFEVDVRPLDWIVAGKAVCAAIFFGLSIGMFNAMMCTVIGIWFNLIFMLSFVALFMASGVYIPVWNMPEQAREFIGYNPIYHLVEWLRSAYFTAYDTQNVDHVYLFTFAGAMMTMALAGERFMRGKFLRN